MLGGCLILMLKFGPVLLEVTGVTPKIINYVLLMNLKIVKLNVTLNLKVKS